MGEVKLKYKRIILKVTGEIFAGSQNVRYRRKNSQGFRAGD